ncbi:hypothetical protein NKR23_g8003 [Pleurostoma richardsiae]|uniref:Uncharacterized protein n=1 Tax=Pleurostoma richardsiae TaxID=41990 RepID=A0AA38R9Z3_9PEZI|nr:hypothetical protein NKR23_g8003 [Pleurostoma richardsiae]
MYALGSLGVLVLGQTAASMASSIADFLLEEDRSNGTVELLDDFWVPVPPIAGTKPFSSYREHPLKLAPRDCLPNGTNYCFGNNVNYCNGVSITTTQTVLVTALHTAIRTVTVREDVVLTSTVNSLIDVTVSSAAATQTDLVFVTTTVDPSPSAVAIQQAHQVREPAATEIPNVLRRSLDSLGSLFKRSIRYPHGIHAALRLSEDTLLRPRQATQSDQSATAATSTASVTVTKTTDITGFVSTTVTQPSTSVVLTTAYRTNTVILNAQTTVLATSTITITPPTPATRTITETADPTVPSSSSVSSSSSRSAALATSTSSSVPPPHNGISTGAIAGIAVGSAVFALIVISLLIAWLRLRRRSGAPRTAQDDFGGGGGYDPPVVHREPRLPVVSPPGKFAPSPPHHGDAFQPRPQLQPAGAYRYATAGGVGQGEPLGAGLVAGPQYGYGHVRSDSAYTGTTQVSSVQGGAAAAAAGAAAAAAAAAKRASATSSPSSGGESRAMSPVEVAGTEAAPRYEVEGSGPGPSGEWGGGYQHRRTGSDLSGGRGSGGGNIGYAPATNF